MRSVWTKALIAAALFSGVIATPSTSEAAPIVIAPAFKDYNVCLRIPVEIDDPNGEVGEIGLDGNWVARGVRVTRVVTPSGAEISGFPRYASASSGCFSFSSIESGTFRITIQSQGRVSGNNVIRIRNEAGSIPSYAANFDLTEGTHAYVWPYVRELPRGYAIYAYAIQSGFRGDYANQTLDIYRSDDHPGSSSGCNRYSGGNISICTGSWGRKHVMVHEYGHANLGRTGNALGNDCSYNGSSHGMRGLEYSNCAAMEGFANFVAAEVWNDDENFAGDDPPATLRYWDGGGGSFVPVEGDRGHCGSPSADRFPRKYAETCFSDPVSAAYNSLCANQDCPGYGTELDWMRAWWDFYTDKDLAGDPLTASELQQFIGRGKGGSRTTAWPDLRDGSTGTLRTRWLQVSGWNGIREGDPVGPSAPSCVGGEGCLYETVGFGDAPNGDFADDTFCDDGLQCQATSIGGTTYGICGNCADERGAGCACDDGATNQHCAPGLQCWDMDPTLPSNQGVCYGDEAPSFACLEDCELVAGNGAFCMHDHPGRARCVPYGTTLPEAYNCWQDGGHMDPQELSCTTSAQCFQASDCHALGYPFHFFCDGTLRCVTNE